MRTHWDTILELTRSMQEFAIGDNWDEFSKALKERQAHLEIINTHCVVSPNIDIAYEIAALNNEILNLAKAKHSDYASKLSHLSYSKKAKKLYTSNAE